MSDTGHDGADPYRGLSLWWDTIDASRPQRPTLPGNGDVDVVVVGAGLTGLWTARSLKLADPAIRIAVVEREVVGFGASGRNGGWCSALFAASAAATGPRARCAGGSGHAPDHGGDGRRGRVAPSPKRGSTVTSSREARWWSPATGRG